MAAPLGAIGIGSTLVGGILGAQGASAAGEATLQQNYYQAGIAKMNADIAKQNADYATNQGEISAMERGIAGGQQLGGIRAAQASSGLDVNSGSSLAVQKGQKFAIDTDVSIIRANAAKAAFDYTAQASNYLSQASLYEMAGTNAAEAGKINAESSILGTVGSVASKWSQGQQIGLFSDWGKASQPLGS